MFNFFKKKKTETKGLKDALSRIRELQENFERLSQELQKVKQDSEFFVQKVSIVRFNPFAEVGGDQSFSLALLDAKDNGVVITSLYTREGNRIYGKKITKGQSTYALSEEEKQAIAKAKNGSDNSKLNQSATRGGGNGTH